MEGDQRLEPSISANVQLEEKLTGRQKQDIGNMIVATDPLSAIFEVSLFQGSCGVSAHGIRLLLLR